MHAQDRENYKHFQKCQAYQAAQELKATGKVKHIGISFHDTANILEMILSEHPEIEIVQIMLILIILVLKVRRFMKYVANLINLF